MHKKIYYFYFEIINLELTILMSSSFVIWQYVTAIDNVQTNSDYIYSYWVTINYDYTDLINYK